jgi:hypothetical protein
MLKLTKLRMNAVRSGSHARFAFVCKKLAGWRQFGDSDTLAIRLKAGEDDGIRYCQARPHRRSRSA